MNDNIPSEEMRLFLENGEEPENTSAIHIDTDRLPESPLAIVKKVLPGLIIFAIIYLSCIGGIILAFMDPEQVKPEVATFFAMRFRESEAYIELNGKKYSTELTVLLLNNQELTDSELARLSEMKNLKILDLSGNNLVSLDWCVADIETLEELILANNNIENISQIKRFPNVKILDISDNEITDLSSIEKLSKLYLLRAGNNQIADITKLTNLNNLQWLYLEHNHIKDISPLGELSELTSLNLAGNDISGLTPLYTLDNLVFLEISDMNISEEEMLEFKEANTRVNIIK
jgi:Leucine-rich repeat (LRR) protein